MASDQSTSSGDASDQSTLSGDASDQSTLSGDASDQSPLSGAFQFKLSCCAEAISLQTWIDFFRNNKTFETEGNAESLPNLLSSIGKIQNVIIHRLNLNFEEVNQFLLNAEEFIRLLDAPLYLDAVKPLRQRIEEVLLMANRDAASIHNEADEKIAGIEAQIERLKREEEGIKRHRDETLDNIRSSIERDIFAAMGQAKDALPDIGLAENR
ncbi:hypothetical protein FOXB_00947 [Fusarium oxysporum f. sp. conglutinans Fo5176]|uniref:Uncharacterized protein n=1 Tax=Fusarium oxysporum (strain Fo5176) TaxID=660025 RepID=F9F3H2_FUSOF|nr:hypothetical protein FOXB_00947 [Fusarium oxysporum f. sp. conglutinans Fo5176]